MNIEQFLAYIGKANNDVANLGRAVEELIAEIDSLTAALNAATKQREMERKEFMETEQDLSDSVDALAQALQVLKSQDYNRPEAAALLQRMAVKTRGMRRVLAMLEETRTGEPGAPAVNAYEFQSSSIVKVLEDLSKKFEAELDKTQIEESNRDAAYNVEKIHLDDTIFKSKADREERAASKAKRHQDSLRAQAELAAVRKQLAEDSKFLSNMKSTFAVKTSAFNENQQVRADELTALGQAIEIISNPSVSGSYAKHINLAQKAVSFLQLRRSGTQLAQVRASAVAFLQSRARELSSDTLANAAKQLTTGPLDKVIGMIESLLARLKEEAAAEADHKAWCDTQLKSNKIKRDKKSSQVEKLTAEIEAYTATIQDMADNIATLSAEQSELAKQMAKATQLRTAEKEKNLATIADAKAGSAAVKNAIVILQEFYNSQSFLQEGKQVPEMAAYKGMQNAKGGVVGMLEVINTDFVRLESETTSAEHQAAREYKDFMAEAQASALSKHNEEVKLKLDKDATEFDRSNTVKDNQAAQEILARANEYFEYLKPSCLQVHVNYEDRVASRKEEIAALREAYKILDQKSKEAA